MRISAALFCCLLGISQAFASNDRALFWKVEPQENNTKEKGVAVYLLGSIHVADKSFYPLREKIEASYDASDHLVVEIDVSRSDPAYYRKILSERGEYQGDDSIANHVTPETLKILKSKLDELDIPMSEVGKLKPGILVMTISMAQIIKMGYSPSMGIDFHFINKDRDKDVIELESVEEQLDVMLDIKDSDLLLEETLRSMESTEALVSDLVSAWKQGDERAMDELLFGEMLDKYPSFTGIYDSLFFERNKKIADSIKRFLKKGDTYFVVVGAGHLVGDRGVVGLLEKDGYIVTRH